MATKTNRLRRELEDQRTLRKLERYADVPRWVARLYAARAQAIRDAYAAGLSVSRIAAALQVSRQVVYDALPEYQPAERGT